LSSRSEYEAAYFTLLRAREEHDHLLRYGEYLRAELERLNDMAAATRSAEDTLPKRLRRPVNQTTKPLMEAIGARRNIVLGEQGRIDDRLRAAQEFVEECEREVEALRE
jgi:BMFP domain-containing protein YqiC